MYTPKTQSRFSHRKRSSNISRRKVRLKAMETICQSKIRGCYSSRDCFTRSFFHHLYDNFRVRGKTKTSRDYGNMHQHCIIESN